MRAQYKIEKIGSRTQRLTQVRIGDPAHPDLAADWIEFDTSLGFSGASISAVRIGHLRTRARLVNGAVTFGAVDRLLPKGSGKPFALPKLHANIADARIALATPQGDVALTLRGAGQLDDGFVGTLDAHTARLNGGGCQIDGAAAALRVKIVQARPSLTAPSRSHAASAAAFRQAARARTCRLHSMPSSTVGRAAHSWA